MVEEIEKHSFVRKITELILALVEGVAFVLCYRFPLTHSCWNIVRYHLFTCPYFKLFQHGKTRWKDCNLTGFSLFFSPSLQRSYPPKWLPWAMGLCQCIPALSNNAYLCRLNALLNCQPDPSTFLLNILDRLHIFLALVFPWADFTDCLSLTSHGPTRIPFSPPQACIFYAFALPCPVGVEVAHGRYLKWLSLTHWRQFEISGQ